MANADPRTPTRGDAIPIDALRAGDLDDVVSIDALLAGRRRGAYFGRRLQAAMRDPAGHAQLAARSDGRLRGYLLARRLRGEFGRNEPALRLEVIGVHPGAAGAGIGAALLAALERYALAHGIREIRTQTRWSNLPLLGFFDRGGFEIAPTLVVEAGVRGPMLEARAADAVPAAFVAPRAEIDYGDQAGSDYERLARDDAEFSSMSSADLPGIVRVDQRRSGRDRTAYLRAALDEAMAESAVRVSLTARVDGSVAGFLMAKVDFGDFGRTEPAAVLDAIGVDPGHAHRGIGHGLLSQLCVNLAALGVDRVESVVACDDFDLLGFLYAAGFAPSQRLSFVRRL